MEKRLVYEHFLCKSFGCKRLELSFVNAGCYDAGVEKHPEIKFVVLCALLALCDKPCGENSRKELKAIANRIDEKKVDSNNDLDKVLEEVNKLIAL